MKLYIHIKSLYIHLFISNYFFPVFMQAYIDIFRPRLMIDFVVNFLGYSFRCIEFKIWFSNYMII